jgi:hypothetical protein
MRVPACSRSATAARSLALSAGGLPNRLPAAFNSIMLSMLLDRHKAAGDEKVVALLQKISPAAWQHVHFLGHYAFRNNYNPIDLEAMLANIKLE